MLLFSLRHRVIVISSNRFAVAVVEPITSSIIFNGHDGSKSEGTSKLRRDIIVHSSYPIHGAFSKQIDGFTTECNYNNTKKSLIIILN